MRCLPSKVSHGLPAVQRRPCRHTAWRSFAGTLFPSQVRSCARSPLCFLTRQATMYLRSHFLEVCGLSHHHTRPCGRGLVEAPRRQASGLCDSAQVRGPAAGSVKSDVRGFGRTPTNRASSPGRWWSTHRINKKGLPSASATRSLLHVALTSRTPLVLASGLVHLAPLTLFRYLCRHPFLLAPSLDTLHLPSSGYTPSW